MIDSIDYIDGIKNKINSIREDQFKRVGFVYEDRIIEKKTLNENLMEYKNYQKNMKKKAMLEKNKPGNINKPVYEQTYNVDILEDDIFHNNVDETKIDDKLDFENMTRDKKLSLIQEFIQRKNINLEIEDLNKIEQLVDNSEINIKKYLNISKMYQQITKVSFIKKLENGSYVFDLGENKIKKAKKFFVK
jgi:hypothetical protein